uniref:ZM domain-containing protein n=1 Tax=Caenorhabditis tropicalis TaxID=1561998 RepID=A0A1I7U576_9PELO
MQKRSRSSSTARQPDPYHAVSEVYTKEVTHRPIGPVSEFPPEILDILREEPRASPPLVRSRENTWTPENFPIVRVPSAQFTDILTELYDYHEVEKYTRSVTPDRRPPTESRIPVDSKNPPPAFQVIPPTPEKNTPRHGIPLSSEKRPLPMYEEYVQMQENRNTVTREKSPLTSSESENQINNNNLRHIDSSSSSEDLEAAKKAPEDPGKRYVYSHDVYVDSTTGRPFTPGREDVKGKKNCDKLKINVYFKPPQPPVEITYQLDEIEIEKQEEIAKLRPFGTILSRSSSGNPSVPLPSSEKPSSDPMDYRRIPTRTSVLRKEHEIVTVPLRTARQSRISEHRRSASRSVTERSINMDDIFPKMPHHLANTHVAPGSIDKGEYRRVPSVVSSHKSSQAPEITRTPSEVRIPVTVTRAPPQTKRQSPEELDYGRFPNEKVGSLPYTRGVSKTPSDKSYSNPVPPAYSNPLPPKSVPSARSSYRSHQTQKSETPELPYTRGVSKTPSDVHVPYNNPDKERAYQQAANGIPRYSNPTVALDKLRFRTQRPQSPGAKARPTSGPFEEIVHIKERYERDETIRRFFPTTTTV